MDIQEEILKINKGVRTWLMILCIISAIWLLGALWIVFNFDYFLEYYTISVLEITK